MINLLREKTSTPVPHLIDYRKDRNNVLNFSYIFMRKSPGKSAYSIWFDQQYGSEDPTYAYRTSNKPSIETEK